MSCGVIILLPLGQRGYLGKMLSRTEELQGGVDKELRRRWEIHPHEDRHRSPLPRRPHGSPGP